MGEKEALLVMLDSGLDPTINWSERDENSVTIDYESGTRLKVTVEVLA